MPDTRLTSRARAAVRSRVSSAPSARRPLHHPRAETATRRAKCSRNGPVRDHGLVRVLVTGGRGSVGAPVAAFLRRAGWEVAGFDLVGGADVLDLPALRRAARGCPSGWARTCARDSPAGPASPRSACGRWRSGTRPGPGPGPAVTAPIRGPPSASAQTPPPRSAGGPPTSGHHRRHHDMAPER